MSERDAFSTEEDLRVKCAEIAATVVSAVTPFNVGDATITLAKAIYEWVKKGEIK